MNRATVPPAWCKSARKGFAGRSGKDGVLKEPTSQACEGQEQQLSARGRTEGRIPWLAAGLFLWPQGPLLGQLQGPTNEGFAAREVLAQLLQGQSFPTQSGNLLEVLLRSTAARYFPGQRGRRFLALDRVP